MKKIKKLLVLFLAVISLTALCSCESTTSESASSETKSESSEKVKVVATIFPEYDFLRQIGKDHIDLEMLLPPGSESHSFEPTPQNIKDIDNSKMFVYVGGDSDEWVNSILDTVDKNNKKIVTLMDCVTTVEEKTVEGMTEEEEEEENGEKEYDEHVWTSPKNAVLIVEKLRDALCDIDSKNAEDYKKNAEEYIEKLNSLDKEFKDVVSNAKRKEIIVGDRFPFRYFADEYDLTYYAAFPGCSSDTEANAGTITFLCDKVKKDKIPVVFHIELSNEKVCNTICDTTGAKSRLLNAAHNLSKEDFDKGVTYVDLMKHNVDVLKEALN